MNPLVWTIEPERNYDDVKTVDFAEYGSEELMGPRNAFEYASLDKQSYNGQYLFKANGN